MIITEEEWKQRWSVRGQMTHEDMSREHALREPRSPRRRYWGPEEAAVRREDYVEIEDREYFEGHEWASQEVDSEEQEEDEPDYSSFFYSAPLGLDSESVDPEGSGADSDDSMAEWSSDDQSVYTPTGTTDV